MSLRGGKQASVQGLLPRSDQIDDPGQLLRQRVYIEFGLNWFDLFGPAS